MLKFIAIFSVILILLYLVSLFVLVKVNDKRISNIRIEGMTTVQDIYGFDHPVEYYITTSECDRLCGDICGRRVNNWDNDLRWWLPGFEFLQKRCYSHCRSKANCRTSNQSLIDYWTEQNANYFI